MCFAGLVTGFGTPASPQDRPPVEVRRRVAALNEEGIAHFEAGDFLAAVRRFEQALELDGGSADLRANLGRAHAAYGGRLVEAAAGGKGGQAASRTALERLQRALLYWPGDAATHRAMAWCHYRLREMPAAETALERSVEIDPKSFDSWRLLGVIREERGRFELAFSAYETALRLKPGDPLLTTRLQRARYDHEAVTSFRALRDERFSIHYPKELSTELAQKIQQLLTSTVKTFAGRWELSEPKGVVVICYPPGEFSKRTGLHEEIGGAFDGRIRIAFPEELEGGGLGIEPVIRHETIHLLLHSAGDRPPRWLDEGLAQFLDGDDRALWFPRFRQALAQSPNVGVTERELQYRSDDPTTWVPLYLHSFFFVKHLAEVGSEFRLDMVVREVRRGTAWDDAFKTVYGRSAADLDREWRRQLLEEPTDSDRSGG
ncbi:MAG: tetratricopeptide repeat protein [Planctomycetota bacterium]